MSVSLLGYATLMDPANAVRSGITSRPVLVMVNGSQRWFGFPDLANRSIDDVFHVHPEPGVGDLRVRDIGATTLRGDARHSFNGVVYTDVPDGVLAELDREEAKSHLERIPLYYSQNSLTGFFSGSDWQAPRDGVVYTYVARERIETPRGTVQLVRQDVLPDPRYLENCRRAARVHGDLFGDTYDRTTFLADQRTTIADYVAWASRR